MTSAPSSTWFTAAPDWEWLIVWYFFLGGLAGGSYFLAALIDFMGRPEDRRVAHVGYYIALPCVAVSGVLLIVDLARPARFWHMLVESHTLTPMFKYWSPMSVGAWALLFFGGFSVVSFAAALAEHGVIARPRLSVLRPPARLGTILHALGGIAGLYLAGYTGVLLAVTNRPIWADTPLLGMLFVVSAASTSAALILLLTHRFELRLPAVVRLHAFDETVLLIELLVLIALIASLGPAARAWLNAWGVLLALTVAAGVIAPLVLSWRARRDRRSNVVATTMLVLAGGLMLRAVIVFSSEAI